MLLHSSQALPKEVNFLMKNTWMSKYHYLRKADGLMSFALRWLSLIKIGTFLSRSDESEIEVPSTFAKMILVHHRTQMINLPLDKNHSYHFLRTAIQMVQLICNYSVGYYDYGGSDC